MVLVLEEQYQPGVHIARPYAHPFWQSEVHGHASQRVVAHLQVQTVQPLAHLGSTLEQHVFLAQLLQSQPQYVQYLFPQ